MRKKIRLQPVLWCTFIACMLTANITFAKKKERQFYQIKIYHLANKEQEKATENFLKDAYLPALHRAGISQVGVFKPIGNDTAKDMRIYVLIPMVSLKQYADLPGKLANDIAFEANGTEYINASHKTPPYKRIETIFLQAFADMPQLQVPALSGAKSQRVYELRSYEGATEKLYRKKVHMFNEGKEIGIFHRLKFNPVFFAEVLAGGSMPNLMYLTTFENKASRDEHWKSFGNDAFWKTISSMPEYQNTVSKADITFLTPADYSDL